MQVATLVWGTQLCTIHLALQSTKEKRLHVKKAEANAKAAAEKAAIAANVKKGKKKKGNNLEPVAEAPATEEGLAVGKNEWRLI